MRRQYMVVAQKLLLCSLCSLFFIYSNQSSAALVEIQFSQQGKGKFEVYHQGTLFLPLPK